MGERVMKQIPNYPHYKASTDGRIWSDYSNKFLVSSRVSGGYTSVELFENGSSKRITVHRLIALTFLPNPNNLPCINHKNEIRDDNHVSNLEWCTHKYNSNYGNCKAKIKANRKLSPEKLRKVQLAGIKAVSRQVKNVSTGEEFQSVISASRKYKVNAAHISEVCKGKRKSAGGYKWEYMKG